MVGSSLTRPSLAQVVEATKTALAARKARVPVEALEARIAEAPPVRGFARALKTAPAAPAVIAEIKEASPSGGLLRPDFDAEAIARAYEAAGARAISVLTEETYFKGSLTRLACVRESVGLPVLQKDFVVDPYQLYEARLAGADAILLIVALLDDAHLEALAKLAATLGMDALVEVHDEAELERALRVDAPLLGINNRNLKTYAIDLGTSEALIARLGDRRGQRTLVAESGIRSRQDVERLAAAGAQGVLIGETLMRRPDLACAYQELFGDAATPTR